MVWVRWLMIITGGVLLGSIVGDEVWTWQYIVGIGLTIAGATMNGATIRARK